MVLSMLKSLYLLEVLQNVDHIRCKKFSCAIPEYQISACGPADVWADSRLSRFQAFRLSLSSASHCMKIFVVVRRTSYRSWKDATPIISTSRPGISVHPIEANVTSYMTQSSARLMVVRLVGPVKRSGLVNKVTLRP